MAYRDDRQALALQLAELEAEKQRLEKALAAADTRFKQISDDQHERRRASARRDGCLLCGGTLLPVAVFAGHDISEPLPLSMSTMRFSQPGGGFTHSAPVHSMACSSCGFIHSFIDIEKAPGHARPDEDPATSDEGDEGEPTR